MKNNKIGILEKLGFMFFSTATNIVYSFRTSYYKYFLTGILLMDPIAASNVVLIGTIWDVVNDPLVGVLANNARFRSGEKVRPWLLWAAVPYALGMVLIFTDFGVNERMDIILALACFFIYELANTFRGIPFNGMAALATSDEQQRKTINGYRSMGATIGMGIGTVLVPIIFKLFGGLKDHKVINSSDGTALFETALCMAVLIIAGCLFHYFTTKERVKQVSSSEEKMGFMESYKLLFSCRSWVMNMLFIMTYGLVTSLSASALFYYCSYVMNNSGMFAPIMSSYLIFSAIFAVLTPRIDEKLGRKKTMILAVLVQLIAKIPFMLHPYNIFLNYLNGISTGIGTAMCFVIFSTHRNKISDIVELKSGRRIDTVVSTADNLASKVAEAVVDKIFLLSLAAAGFSAKLAEKGLSQSIATQNTIISMITWIPAIILVLMLIISLNIDVNKEYDELLAKQNND